MGTTLPSSSPAVFFATADLAAALFAFLATGFLTGVAADCFFTLDLAELFAVLLADLAVLFTAGWATLGAVLFAA